MKNVDMTTQSLHPLDDPRTTNTIGRTYAFGYEAGRQDRGKQAIGDEERARQDGYESGWATGAKAEADSHFRHGTVNVGPTDPSKLEANFIWLSIWHEAAEIGGVYIDFGDAEGIIEGILAGDGRMNFDLVRNVGALRLTLRMAYDSALVLASDLRAVVSKEEGRREQNKARG